jgi:hypothetical protein
MTMMLFPWNRELDGRMNEEARGNEVTVVAF